MYYFTRRRRVRSAVGFINLVVLSLLLLGCGDYTHTPAPTVQKATATSQLPTTTSLSTANPSENSPATPSIQAGLLPETATPLQSAHLSSVDAIAYSPDGKILATGSQDGQVKLWQASNGQFLTTLTGHTQRVTDLSYSPDGKTLASSSQDKTVKLWDTTTFKEIATLHGHTEQVDFVAFSPDGKTLVSSSRDGYLKLWDVASRHEKQALPLAFGPLAFSPNGKWLVSAASSAKDKGLDLIKIWDAQTGKEITTLKSNPNSYGQPTDLAFRPDSGALAIGRTERSINGMGAGSVTLWEVGQDATALRELYTKDNLIGLSSLAFSPDGKIIVIAGHAFPKGEDARYLNGIPLKPLMNTITDLAVSKGSFQLLDTTNGTVLNTVEDPSSGLRKVVFNPAGKTFATGGSDRSIKIWQTSQPDHSVLTVGQPTYPKAIAYSADGHWLAAGGVDGDVRLIETLTGQLRATLKGHQDAVLTVAFSPDGKLIASGGKDGAVMLWDVAQHKSVTNWAAHSYWVNALAFSPDGKTLASGSSDTTIKLWDVTKPGSPALSVLQACEAGVWALAFSPDGKTLASTGYFLYDSSSSIQLWDMVGRRQLPGSINYKGSILALAFSPDNLTLAGITSHGGVKTWNFKNGKEIKTFRTDSQQGGFILSSSTSLVGFSPDGQTLVGSLLGEGQESFLKTWEVATGREGLDGLKNNPAIVDRLEAFAVGPDGQSLTLGYADASLKTVKLTALANPVPTPTPTLTSAAQAAALPTVRPTLSPLKPFELKERYQTPPVPGHRGSISKVVFSPNGRVLFSTDAYTIKEWDITTKKELRSWPAYGQGLLALSADGKILATDGPNNALRLWDVTSGKVLTDLKGHTEGLQAVAISPDGQTIATSAGDYDKLQDIAIRLWRVADGKELGRLSGHTKRVRYLAFAPDGLTLASATYEGQLKTWEVTTGKLKSTLQDNKTEQLLSLTYSPDGKTLAATEYLGSIRLWDSVTGKLDQKRGHMYNSGLAFSPDSQTIAIGDEGSPNQESFVRLYDRAGQQLAQIPSQVENTKALAFSPDGKLLAFAGGDGTNREFDSDIKLWNVADNKEYTTLKGNGGGSGLAWVSPDGKTFISQVSAYTFKRYEVTTGHELASVNTPYLGGSSLAVSPDGQTLATLGEDKVIRFYDLTTGQPGNLIYGQQSRRSAITFRPDGKALLALDDDAKGQRILHLWDVLSPDSKELVRWSLPTPERGGWPFDTASYSPNGQVIALVHTNYGNQVYFRHDQPARCQHRPGFEGACRAS